MFPANRKHPNPKTIDRFAMKICDQLFYQNHDVYGSSDIIRLLNKISKDKMIPSELSDIPWGDSIIGSISIQDAMHNIGTKGTKMQKCQKSAIASSITSIKSNKIINRKLLKAILPHSSKKGKNKFIKKCQVSRIAFNDKETDILWTNIKYKRAS